MRRQDLANRIDHTLLGPTASAEGVRKLCEEAKKHGFISVCVNPCHAHLASELLKETDVKLCIVVGFPHGMATGAVKAYEAQKAIAAGADELDMVINVAALIGGDYAAVLEDIQGVCSVAEKASRSVIVKVILETALLDAEQKQAGAILVKAGGASFVKTSTGFGPGGATVEDVALLREVVGPEMGVKAAGGIRDYAAAVAMMEAGATRLGASRSVAIVEAAPE